MNIICIIDSYGMEVMINLDHVVCIDSRDGNIHLVDGHTIHITREDYERIKNKFCKGIFGL